MRGEEIINEYTNWIKDNSFVRNVSKKGDMYVITTPFMDSHNDHVDLYVKKGEDNTLHLSDDGYTISDLMMSGTDLFSTSRRKKTFETTLNRYGVAFNKMTNELVIEAKTSNIAVKKHSLLQAIMAVNDLYVVSRENITSFFKEDIEAYLRQKDITFMKAIKLTGKTGFDHNVDFVVPESKNQPERLIQAINTPRKEQIMSAIFSFNDISAVREDPTRRIVLYNDEVSEISTDTKKALDEYDINVFRWSEKEKFAEALILN